MWLVHHHYKLKGKTQNYSMEWNGCFMEKEGKKERKKSNSISYEECCLQKVKLYYAIITIRSETEQK